MKFKLKKDEHGQMIPMCNFCEGQSTKVLIWGGGVRFMNVCSEHIQTGIHQIVSVNKDTIKLVIDLETPEATDTSPSNFTDRNGEEYKVVNITINGNVTMGKEEFAETFMQSINKALEDEKMPFASNAALPKSVRDALPEKAQTVFRTVANSQLDSGLSEDRAFRSAWGALKNQGWEKQDTGKWVQVNKAMIQVGMMDGHVHSIEDTEPNGETSVTQGHSHTYRIGQEETGEMDGHSHPMPNSTIEKAGHKNKKKPKSKAKDGDEDEDGKPSAFEVSKNLLKTDEELQLVTGVVMEPEVVDSHGDITSAEEIRQAAHEFMRKSRVIGLQHSKQAPVEVVESFITPVDMEIGGQEVKKGSWVMTTKVHDAAIWSQVKKGDFTGYSVGGMAVRNQ